MTGYGRVLVTAGPTREKIDPIRFISNLSSGFMGYEIARAARARGYKVTLVSGPTSLIPPKGVSFVPVESAREMSRVVASKLKSAEVLFMASAVCDWRPQKNRARKVKKTGRDMTLRLVKNPDILCEAGKKKGKTLLVGFALESDHLARHAKEKLREKNLDIIAANKIARTKSPFGKGLTDVLTITRNGESKWLKRASKRKVADYLIDKAEELWQN